MNDTKATLFVDRWFTVFIKNMAMLRFLAMMGALGIVTAVDLVEVWTVVHHNWQKGNLAQQQLNILNQVIVLNHLLILMGMAALTLQKLSIKVFGNEAKIGDETDKT